MVLIPLAGWLPHPLSPTPSYFLGAGLSWPIRKFRLREQSRLLLNV